MDKLIERGIKTLERLQMIRNGGQTIRVSITMTPQEKDILKSYCSLRGVSCSNLFRRLLNDEVSNFINDSDVVTSNRDHLRVV